MRIAAAFASLLLALSLSSAVQAEESAVVSRDARAVAQWVSGTDDNQDLPFVIVDKIGAEVLVFDARGRMLGTAPVLLGAAHGDDTPPGVGDKPLAQISAAERITPAGRFVASLGTNQAGKDILWVDYAAAISLHRVVTSKPAERRLERLATASVADNRISFGCINVPADFYDRVVRPLFTDTVGIVYILPETRTIQAEFFAPALRNAALKAGPVDVATAR
jgi:hypothetical protein